MLQIYLLDIYRSKETTTEQSLVATKMASTTVFFPIKELLLQNKNPRTEIAIGHLTFFDKKCYISSTNASKGDLLSCILSLGIICGKSYIKTGSVYDVAYYKSIIKSQFYSEELKENTLVVDICHYLLVNFGDA